MKNTATTDRFQLQRLLSEAREMAGVADNFQDEEIIEPLELILHDLRNGTAQLSPLGAEGLYAQLLAGVMTRMQVLDRVAKYPEILEQEICAPVFITGLPRTGTTKLQRVLAASGLYQYLPLWKILSPVPAIDAVDNDKARRIAIATQEVQRLQQLFPRFYAAHPMLPDQPDEEALILEMSWKVDPPCWRAHLPTFQAWLLQQDIRSSYQWLKTVLQLEQWLDESRDQPRPWVLKAPGHLGRIDEIYAVFSDAVLVHCHRDPCQALPSGAGMAEEMRGFYSDSVKPEHAGQFVTELLSHDMNRYLQSRPRWEAQGKRFVDVRFAEIVEDAADVCQRVTEAAGNRWRQTAAEQVQAWEVVNPPGKFGKFEYSLAQYGMTEEDVRLRFAQYGKQYLDW